MGDISDLKLVNNGDGTYYCECVPHSNGHVTIQICLHGEPIKNSPLTIQVGDKQKYSTRQVAQPAPKPQPTQQQQPPRQQPSQVHQQPPRQSQQPTQPVVAQRNTKTYDRGIDDILDSYNPNSNSSNNVEVTNDDLNALLDELGGY